jgi:hypothetical protein
MTPSQTPTLQQSFLQFGSSNTSGGASLRAGQRVALSLTTGYSVGGGLNHAARTYIPWQYSLSVGAAVSYTASTRDNVVVSAGAAETVTSGPCLPPLSGHCQETVPYGVVRATLRHQLSVRAAVTFSAGAWASVVTTDTVRETLLAPVASAALSYRLGEHGTDSLGLSAGLDPAIDVRTGYPSYRVSTTGSLVHPVSPTVTMTGTAGVTKSIPFPVFFAAHPETASVSSDPNPITAFDAGVDVRFRLQSQRALTVGTLEFLQFQTGFAPLGSITVFARITITRELDVGAGVQTFWQGLSSYDTLSGQTFTSGFVTVTGRLQTLRF